MIPVQGMDLMLTILESPVLIYMIIIQLVVASLVITLSKLIIYMHTMYCDMELQCSGHKGGWMKIADYMISVEEMTVPKDGIK